MKSIKAEEVSEIVAQLCIEANTILRKDVFSALQKAFLTEENKLCKKIFGLTIENARIAQKDKLAICQDTGLPVVFVELGQQVKIEGDLTKAVNSGVELGYRKGSLRNSIIMDPILRTGNSKFSPVVIHVEINNSDHLKITVLPKGFGCENKSKIKMFNPTAKLEEIMDFIVETVGEAGPDACPPYIIGVGIGGTNDKAAFLAKKALLRPVNRQNRLKHIKILEKKLLHSINKLNIGVMGFGGRVTALAVNVEIHPTHIAGLPVAVNISCHALRSASKIL